MTAVHTPIPSTHATEIDHTQTINEIVARNPRTLDILHRFGLDTCCGGALPLAEAVAHHQLNLADVKAALAGGVDAER